MNLLGSVPEPQRTRVLDACRRRTYARDAILFHEGDVSDGLHIVESGHLVISTSVASGETVTLDVLGPGDVLGEISLVLPSHVRSATVAALDECTTRMLSVSAFEVLCDAHPEVTSGINRLLAERVQRLTGQLSEALFVKVEMRVARRVLRIAGMYGGVRSGTVVPLTQQNLADLAGATRPTVNQTLKKFESAGAVALFRGGLRIVDAQCLQGFAGV